MLGYESDLIVEYDVTVDEVAKRFQSLNAERELDNWLRRGHGQSLDQVKV